MASIPLTYRKRERLNKAENFIERNKDHIQPKSRKVYCRDSIELTRESIDNVWRERFVTEVFDVKRGSSTDSCELLKQKIDSLKRIEQAGSPRISTDP